MEMQTKCYVTSAEGAGSRARRKKRKPHVRGEPSKMSRIAKGERDVQGEEPTKA